MAADEQRGYDREFLGIWLFWLWSEYVRPALLLAHREMVAAGLADETGKADDDGR